MVNNSHFLEIWVTSALKWYSSKYWYFGCHLNSMLMKNLIEQQHQERPPISDGLSG